MKFINKLTRQSLAVLLCTAMIFSFSGCGKQNKVPNAYKLSSDVFGLYHTGALQTHGSCLMGANLCVANENTENPAVDMSLAEGAGLFDISNFETIYAKNVHEKLYPASTTKILTAYVVLKHGNLEDVVTISQENIALEADSSHCGLKVGDQLSVKELLYGLMLKSANDAANALADYISGNTENFAELMNKEANLLGATNSHFVNAHGLHDDEHYTTVYDLYLIFQNALQNETFREIAGSTSYVASYQDVTATKSPDKNKCAKEGDGHVVQRRVISRPPTIYKGTWNNGEKVAFGFEDASKQNASKHKASNRAGKRTLTEMTRPCILYKGERCLLEEWRQIETFKD